MRKNRTCYRPRGRRRRMGVVVQLIMFTITTVTSLWFLALVTLLVFFKLYLECSSGDVATMARLEGKLAIVTGSNTGIGYETAYHLASRGARVILACRDIGAASGAREEIIRRTHNKHVEVRKLDLSSLASVRQFATDILEVESHLDILVHNAGASGLANKQTEDGIQIEWQINHYAPFLLTNLLLELMTTSAPARIIWVSSAMHRMHNFTLDNANCERSFCPFMVNNNTKLANIMSANCLANRLVGTGVTVNSLHPGFVKTAYYRRVRNIILRSAVQLFLYCIAKTPQQGAKTTVFLALDKQVEGVSGKFFMDCKESKCVAAAAKDQALCEELWRKSEQLVKLEPKEKY